MAWKCLYLQTLQTLRTNQPVSHPGAPGSRRWETIFETWNREVLSQLKNLNSLSSDFSSAESLSNGLPFEFSLENIPAECLVDCFRRRPDRQPWKTFREVWDKKSRLRELARDSCWEGLFVAPFGCWEEANHYKVSIISWVTIAHEAQNMYNRMG